MPTITHLGEKLQELFWEDAMELGRLTGFIKRQRKLCGRSFAQTLVFGALNEADLSYTDMSQDGTAVGVHMSAQAFAQRFTAEAVEFMRQLLDAATMRVIDCRARTAIPILKRFSGVYLRDSSVISLPPKLHEMWPGVGGTAGATAAMKLQIRLEYTSGRLDGPVVQTGRTHDRATPYQCPDEPVGSLVLQDLGYYCLDEIEERNAQGKYVVTRYKIGTALYLADGSPLPLLKWLRALGSARKEVQVWVGRNHRIPMRLILERVPQEAVDRRRRRIREYARKKGVIPKQDVLILANWTLLLTNVPVDKLSIEDALVLARVRWQVELVFKLWKSYLKVDEWRSENIHRILCEVYAKLIGAVLMHWVFLLTWSDHVGRSMFKAGQAIQRFALFLARAIYERREVDAALILLRDCIAQTCHINKRRRNPATFQHLLALTQGGLN